jgi:hypothetical protein
MNIRRMDVCTGRCDGRHGAGEAKLICTAPLGLFQAVRLLYPRCMLNSKRWSCAPGGIRVSVALPQMQGRALRTCGMQQWWHWIWTRWRGDDGRLWAHRQCSPRFRVGWDEDGEKWRSARRWSTIGATMASVRTLGKSARQG